VPVLCALLLVLLSSAIASAQQADVALAVGTITDDNYPGRESAGNGLGEVILHHLVTTLGDGGEFAWCAGKVVEWRRIDEVIKEQKFQQSKYADPATAIKKLGTIAPDFLIGGRITFGAGKADWTIEIRTNPGGDLVDSFTAFQTTMRIWTRLPGLPNMCWTSFVPARGRSPAAAPGSR
jgi:hypothetical protein